MSPSPRIEGVLEIRSSAGSFIAALRRRVAAGLLSGGPGPRQNYEVVDRGEHGIGVRAVDWLTAINVGLNELDLDLSEPGTLRFRLRYPRWAAYCCAVCAALGIVGIGLLLTVDLRRLIANHPKWWLPGLTPEQNVLVAWGNVLFWGFVWPWILVAKHKPPLQQLLARLIADIDADAVDAMSDAG
jgi:hypothetical protein